MSGKGYGQGGMYGYESPRRWSCPRCGAMEGDACESITNKAEYATILGYHSERGLSPGQLEDRGYEPYRITHSPGFDQTLWRTGRQRPVDRSAH